MKRFLTILSVAAMSAFTLQSCLSDQVFQGPPSIDAVSISPKVGSVTPNDDVTVTAKITVTESEITAVALRYTVAQGMENMVNMTKAEENTYTAVIPKQEDGKEVEYYITAIASNDKSSASAKMKYTVSWTRSEYGKLSDIILSEISTGTKFIEIYNTSSLPVDIGGIRFAKNGTKEWFANAEGAVVVPTGTILEGGRYAVLGCKSYDPANDMPDDALSLGIATSGISGSKSLLVIMQDSEGNALDYFVNVAESGHAPDDACWDSALEIDFSTGKSGSAARFLEGGKWVWYEAETTVGAANVKTDGGAKFNNTIDLGALPAAAIASVAIAPAAPTFENDVVVTAEVANATEVSLTYVAGSGSAVKVAMAESEGKYTATIPAQAANTIVKYTISAVGQDGNTVESETGEYTVMGEVVEYDYTKLVLNELNGNAKYIEIYNSGDVEVDLAGCFIRKDNDAEGDVAIPSCKVAAKGYQIIACSGYAGSHTEIQYPNGLSAKKAVAIELLDPEKNSIDKFETANTIENKEASYSRVPDGDGKWYYAAPTEGAANGISTGVIGRDGLLVINEISGSDKKVEVYNGSDAEIKLEGYTFEKDGEVKWTGSADETIAAGEYKVFEFNKSKTGAGYITSGFSGKKSVSLVLKDAEGKEVDAFIRGRMTDDGTGTLVWGEQSLEEKAEYSFSRISKGSWQYAEPSLGAANTEAKAEIKNN